VDLLVSAFMRPMMSCMPRTGVRSSRNDLVVVVVVVTDELIVLDGDNSTETLVWLTSGGESDDLTVVVW